MSEAKPLNVPQVDHEKFLRDTAGATDFAAALYSGRDRVNGFRAAADHIATLTAQLAAARGENARLRSFVRRVAVECQPDWISDVARDMLTTESEAEDA